MGRSRELGMVLAIGSVISMVVMVIGVMRRSYLVIALPVLAMTGLVSALTFWVGWTIANTEEDLAELEAADVIPAAV
jgi:hypothetical protein